MKTNATCIVHAVIDVLRLSISSVRFCFAFTTARLPVIFTAQCVTLCVALRPSLLVHLQLLMEVLQLAHKVVIAYRWNDKAWGRDRLPLLGSRSVRCSWLQVLVSCMKHYGFMETLQRLRDWIANVGVWR